MWLRGAWIQGEMSMESSIHVPVGVMGAGSYVSLGVGTLAWLTRGSKEQEILRFA